MKQVRFNVWTYCTELDKLWTLTPAAMCSSLKLRALVILAPSYYQRQGVAGHDVLTILQPYSLQLRLRNRSER